MAKHVYTYIDPPSERDLDEASQVLADGGIVAYPTDVNWAIGCDVTNAKAIDKIRALKPSHKKEQPFSLICSSISMISDIATVTGTDYRLLKRALPGPFTILLNRNRSLARQINDKRRIVGVRIPDSPLLVALVEKIGHPIATTSVPVLSGFDLGDAAGIAKFGYQVEADFGHGLDLILDLGNELEGLETSVVDMTGDSPTLVRQGVGDVSLFDI